MKPIEGWIMDLWMNPDNMVVFHLAIVLIMSVSLQGKRAMKLITIAFLMLIADCIWMILPEMNLTRNSLHFPYSLFWWQSTLNILFLSACIITLKGAYNTRLISKYQARVEHDKFMAFESNKIRA